MNFKKLTVKKVIEVASYGNHGASYPIKVIASDGEAWLLKTTYNNTSVAEGCCHVFPEVLAYLIADYTKIKPYLQEMALIEVTANTVLMAESALEQDSKENEQALRNLRNSLGTNFAVKWLDDADKPASLANLPKTLVHATILTDAILMNSDRSESNPNIIHSVSSLQTKVIDFGLGLKELTLCEQAKTKGVAIAFHHAKTCIFEKDYLFYEQIDEISFPKNKPSKDDILNAMTTIPTAWASDTVKKAVAELIVYRFHNKSIVQEKQNASL